MLGVRVYHTSDQWLENLELLGNGSHYLAESVRDYLLDHSDIPTISNCFDFLFSLKTHDTLLPVSTGSFLTLITKGVVTFKKLAISSSLWLEVSEIIYIYIYIYIRVWEDLPEWMYDRDVWWERFREICASSAIYIYAYIYICVCVCVCMCVCVYIYIYIISRKNNIFYFPIGSDEVLLKIILESLIHINALNRMEINLLS